MDSKSLMNRVSSNIWQLYMQVLTAALLTTQMFSPLIGCSFDDVSSEKTADSVMLHNF